MAKPNKRRGASLKLAGTAVILTSFLSQWFLYETWNQQAQDLQRLAGFQLQLEQWADLAELSHLQALGYGLPTMSSTDLAAQKIRDAATKILVARASKFGPLSAGGAGISEASAEVIAEALKVSNHAQYVALKTRTEQLAKQSASRIDTRRTELSERRAYAKWAYLLLYAVGSFVLLAGLLFEWKGAEE